VLVVLSVLCAFLRWRAPAAVATPPSKGRRSVAKDEPLAENPVTWSQRLHWIALAFVPSSLMLGATTYITTDIAAIPLLWVLPLALYLLSFILVFSRLPSWVHKGVTLLMPLIVLLLLCMVLSRETLFMTHW